MSNSALTGAGLQSRIERSTISPEFLLKEEVRLTKAKLIEAGWVFPSEGGLPTPPSNAEFNGRVFNPGLMYTYTDSYFQQELGNIWLVEKGWLGCPNEEFVLLFREESSSRTIRLSL